MNGEPWTGLLGLLILAILIEAIVEHLPSFPERYKSGKFYLASLIGIVLCLAYNADLFAVLGFESRFAEVGAIFTGFVLSRGSNFVNLLFKRLSTIQAPATNIDNVPPPRTPDSAEEEALAEWERVRGFQDPNAGKPGMILVDRVRQPVSSRPPDLPVAPLKLDVETFMKGGTHTSQALRPLAPEGPDPTPPMRRLGRAYPAAEE